MDKIMIIAKREYQTYWDSLVAYILLIVFLAFTGAFTWLVLQDVFMQGQANLNPLFQWADLCLFFFIPALTMRTFAEERRTGTLEVLLTRAVTDWQVIMGKYLGSLMLILTALAFTLPYYITVSYLGPVDHGAVICGYLGLILLSSAYIGVGIFVSSFTDNQIVAFLLTLVCGVFFFWIFDLASFLASGVIGEFFHFLSMSTHFESISRGVIDSRDVIFFLSITVLGLILAEVQLARRNVVDA